LLLFHECFRHAKAIGACGEGVSSLEIAGITHAPGILTGTDPSAVFADVHAALGAHRVWERPPDAELTPGLLILGPHMC
jgi:catalase